MMWNYRIVRNEIGRYSVREVYQERDGTLITYSKTPVAPVGASAEDLLPQLENLREAFDLPILSVVELEAALRKAGNQPAKPSGANISLQQLKAELALEAEVA